MLDQQTIDTNKTNYIRPKFYSESASTTVADFIPTKVEELASLSEESEQLFLKISPIPPSIGSPFVDIIQTEQKKREILIEEIKELPRKYSNRLYKRIQILKETAEEEYPYEDLLSNNSLEGFLKFMKRQESFNYPDSTLTPDGNIRIQWQQDKVHHLAIEFISNTEAKFVIFAPDPAHPIKIARLSGKVTIDSVIDAVAPFHALKWVAE